jgi:lysophospholipase L1-like esterase
LKAQDGSRLEAEVDGVDVHRGCAIFMNSLPKSLRVFLGVVTAGVWLLVVYLATHRSESGEILGRYSRAYFAFLLFFCVLAVIISILNVEPLQKRIYENRYSFVLLFISTVLTLGIAEIYVRVADPLGISYYEQNARGDRLKIADPDLIFRLRPQVERTSSSGTILRINEHGLRDDPIGPKKEGEYRIVALGDSVTYGSGVAQDDIFTVRLQRILAAKLNRPVRVINTGVGGYNTVQEHTYLRKYGLSFHPDMIILMYVPNDVEINKGPFKPSTGSLKGKTPSEVVQTLLGRSWLYRLTHHAYRYNWVRDSSHPSIEAQKASPGWQASMQALKGIAEICAERNIPFVVFFFRWRTSGDPALFDDVRMSVAPFPTQNTGQWFVNRPLEKLVNSQVDTHPNSEGHRIIAENMAAYLVKQDFFYKNGSKSPPNATVANH